MEILITESQYIKIFEQQKKVAQTVAPKNATYTTGSNVVLTNNNLTGGNLTIPKGIRFTAHTDKSTNAKFASVDRYEKDVKTGKNTSMKYSTIFYCEKGKFWNVASKQWYYDKSKALSTNLITKVCGKDYGDKSKVEKIDTYFGSNDFKKKCPLNLTVNKPGGNKTNTASVNIFKYWNKDKNNKDVDPLLYSNGLTGTYAKVPADFGWRINNDIYPYPTIYSQSCVDASGEYAKEQSKFSNSIKTGVVKEYTDPNLIVAKSDNTNVSKSYLGNQVDFRDKLTKQQKWDNSLGKQMIDFNKSLIQQKSLIPKYCTTPLTRTGKKTFEKFQSIASVSMYNLCREFGGLWVYGVGTGQYTCGCRDMSNPTISMNLKSSTGDINIGQTINKSQTSRNWDSEDSNDLIVNALAFAAAFVPVVGPLLSAGISLGNAAYKWNKGDTKGAAIDAFFALLPIIGKIPGIGTISKNISTSIGSKLLSKAGLTGEELNTLKKIMEYDTAISKQVVAQLEKSGAGKIRKHIISTAAEETEKMVGEYSLLPSRDKLKKTLAKKLVGGEKEVA